MGHIVYALSMYDLVMEGIYPALTIAYNGRLQGVCQGSAAYIDLETVDKAYGRPEESVKKRRGTPACDR